MLHPHIHIQWKIVDIKLFVPNSEIASWKFHLPSDGQKSEPYNPTDYLFNNTVTTIQRVQRVTSLPEVVASPKGQAMPETVLGKINSYFPCASTLQVVTFWF